MYIISINLLCKLIEIVLWHGNSPVLGNYTKSCHRKRQFDVKHQFDVLSEVMGGFKIFNLMFSVASTGKLFVTLQVIDLQL